MVSFEDVQAAAQRLQGIAHRTPVATSRTLDERLGARLFFKCENFQRMGAFKFRGAYNALARLDARRSARAACSRTRRATTRRRWRSPAGCSGRRSTVVMPQDAPSVKVAATAATVPRWSSTIAAARARARRSAAAGRRSGDLVLIPPFDHADVIAGQGTAAAELIEEAGPLDLLLVPCGGGGLLSGRRSRPRAPSPRPAA